MLRRSPFLTLVGVLLVILLTPVSAQEEPVGDEIRMSHTECFTYTVTIRSWGECETCNCRQCNRYIGDILISEGEPSCLCKECAVTVDFDRVPLGFPAFAITALDAACRV